MGHLKEFLHKITSGNAGPSFAPQKKGNADHDYAMNTDENEEEKSQQDLNQLKMFLSRLYPRKFC